MQAARGTSVATPSADPTRGRRLRLQAVFVVVALLAYATDLVTKVLAVEKLTDHPDVELVGELLQLRLIRNPGAAFSAGTEFTPVLSVIAILAALAVLWFVRKVGSLGWSVALGFLMAGITGNLTDRLFRAPEPLHGHVVDFLMLPNWPIFNIADVCINIAAVLIVIQALRGIRLDGARDEAEDVDDADPDTADTALADAATATQRPADVEPDVEPTDVEETR